MTDEELKAAIRSVRERVENRKSTTLHAPDLMPLVHARDAAEAKVASIGTVNPRAGGFANSVIQSVKRLVARALAWHVREQVEFNRASLAATQATLEALNETNRALGVLANQVQDYARQVNDHRNDHEIYVLRTVSELQTNFRAKTEEIRRNLAKAAEEQERMIHSELRLIRQRSAPLSAILESLPVAATPVVLDWLRFAERFRGSEEVVRKHQRLYVERFAGATNVVDLGCGRGEFLEVARDAGLAANGVDSNPEFVSMCRAKGLDAKQGDLFAYLANLPDGSLGGALCSHVVEHLDPAALPALIQLLARKLRAGALLAIETPNPACLAIFATHFYLDPTHIRPVPAALLEFYLQEAGFGALETVHFSPAAKSLPAVDHLPAEVIQTFFGGMDYAIFGKKL